MIYKEQEASESSASHWICSAQDREQTITFSLVHAMVPKSGKNCSVESGMSCMKMPKVQFTSLWAGPPQWSVVLEGQERLAVQGPPVLGRVGMRPLSCVKRLESYIGVSRSS